MCQYGANIGIGNKAAETALDLAIFSDRFDLVKILITKGKAYKKPLDQAFAALIAKDQIPLASQVLKYHPDSLSQESKNKLYIQVFILKYRKMMKTDIWVEDNIHSGQDLISYAYSKKKEKREAIRSTLLELGWIKKEKKQALQLTKQAPPGFQSAVENFNQDREKMLHLKGLYKNQAGFFSRNRNARKFFEDQPPYEVALDRLIRKSAENPANTASRVLNLVNRPKRS